MIGRNWTNRSSVLRMGAVMPVAAVILYRLVDPPLPMRWVVAAMAVFVVWLGFVVARVTLNEHRAASATPPFRSRAERR